MSKGKKNRASQGGHRGPEPETLPDGGAPLGGSSGSADDATRSIKEKRAGIARDQSVSFTSRLLGRPEIADEEGGATIVAGLSVPEDEQEAGGATGSEPGAETEPGAAAAEPATELPRTEAGTVAEGAPDLSRLKEERDELKRWLAHDRRRVEVSREFLKEKDSLISDIQQRTGLSIDDPEFRARFLAWLQDHRSDSADLVARDEELRRCVREERPAVTPEKLRRLQERIRGREERLAELEFELIGLDAAGS